MIVSTPLSTIALSMWRATAAARNLERNAISLLEDMTEETRLPKRFRLAAMNNLASAVCGQQGEAFESDPDFGPEAA